MEKTIQQRILILDGAMGTMIQQYGLTEADFRGVRFDDSLLLLKGNNDLLNLTRPDVIEGIHRKYIEAGADIITTNTFCSQRISQSDYSLEEYAREMAIEGAKIARHAVDEYCKCSKDHASGKHPLWVAGSVGPTNKMLSMTHVGDCMPGKELTYDRLLYAYSEQIDALIEGGVDAILIETVFDTLNAKVALRAAMEVMESRNIQLPIMVSVTLDDKTGRTICGQTLDAFLASINGFPIFSVGLNCSFGAKAMKPFLKELSTIAPYYISAYPNAGLPNVLGQYDDTPENMATIIMEYIQEGIVNIVGGCCGTTDEHIKKFAKIVKENEVVIKDFDIHSSANRSVQRATPYSKSSHLVLSGLDALSITSEKGFINVGERCNVTGSKKFLRLINQKDYTAAVDIARKQVEDGASLIDVNMDDALLDAKKEMVTFLRLIASEPKISRVPIVIDSSNWDVIEDGLKCVQGKCIVNSLSLKEGEDSLIERATLLKKYGAAVIVMCFDEQGQATTFERRTEIANRAYQILTQKVGIRPYDIIFDPNILTIATGLEEHRTCALDFLNAAKWIKKHCPQSHVCGGVSNLSFAFRGNNYIREAMHAVFLYHAIQFGMDFGIVNTNMQITYSDIPKDIMQAIEDVIFDCNDNATERLVKIAESIKQTDMVGIQTSKAASEDWRQLSIEARLSYSITNGIDKYLEVDVREVLKSYPQIIDIIDGPLMQAMDTVGKLFGEGKLFLPQVIKSAYIMKRAVTMLQPYIETRGEISQPAQIKMPSKKIILATVKGDVHDIGKNIVNIIMSCNGYEVCDLGVMVSAEDIVNAAITNHADIVGLSGLITPSLDEMVNVARTMQQNNLDIPLMIGGAATSEMYVALRIAPEYRGTVIWVENASQNPLIASKLQHGTSASILRDTLNKRYEDLRMQYLRTHDDLKELNEARSNCPNLF